MTGVPAPRRLRRIAGVLGEEAIPVAVMAAACFAGGAAALAGSVLALPAAVALPAIVLAWLIARILLARRRPALHSVVSGLVCGGMLTAMVLM